MASNPFITRFTVGKTYRLHTSPTLSGYRSGTVTIRAELTPLNQWGSRMMLVDAVLNPVDGKGGKETRLGTRCYVEEGFAELKDSYGTRTIPVEIATLQGIYPDKAKAYANAEVHRGGFTPITTTSRIVA